MSPERSNGPTTAAKLATSLAGALATAVGGLVLGGWASDITILKSILPGWVSVKPNTALAFILTGVALLPALHPPGPLNSSAAAGRPAPFRHPLSLLARISGLLAGLIGLLTLIEYASGWNLGLDQWLFPEPPGTVGTSHPGRMAPDTALCFVLLAASLEIARSPRKMPRTPVAATVLASLVATLALTAIVSYFTRVFGGYGWWGLTIMAVPTAVVFAVLSLAIILVAWLERRRGPALAGWAVDPTDARARFAFLLVFLVLLAGIVATGTSYFRAYEKRYLGEIERQLSAIVELKVGELAQWRKERLGDAASLFQNELFTAMVRRAFEHPDDAEARRQLQAWLGKIQTSYHYERVFLLDARSIERLAAPAAPEPIPADLAADAAIAQQSRQVAFLDFHRHAPDRPIHLGLLVPILEEPAFGPPLGILILRIDPATYLYPLIQRWPTPSPTAETLLVRREGDEVLFLNELRHRSGTALVLRRSIDDQQLPAAKAIRGDVAMSEGIDYRGSAVVAASQAVPDSPWVLIAKVDQTELYAPVRGEAWRTGVMGGLLLLAAAFAGIAFWRQRHAALLRRELDLEHERKTLAERLALVTRYANDIILLLDATGRIVEANDRALAVYGYSLDELRRLPPGGLRATQHTGDLPSHLDLLASSDGAVFETVHRHRDGTTFPVEVSGRAVETEGQSFSLGVYRDLTERKRAEQALRESERLYRGIGESIDYGVWVCAPDGRNTYASESFLRLVGISQEQCSNFGWGEVLHPDDARRTIEAWKECVRTGGNWDIEHRFRGVDGKWHPILARGVPVRDDQGQITCWAGINLDIGRLRQAEENLRQSEEFNRRIIESSTDCIKVLDLDARLLSMSSGGQRLLGIADISPYLNQSWVEFWQEADRPRVREAVRAARTGGIGRFQAFCAAVTGEPRWWDVIVTPINDAAGRPWQLLAVSRDITERTAAEDALRQAHERLRRFVDSNLVGIVVAGSDGSIHEANDYYLHLIGYTREELAQGKVDWRAITPSEWLPVDEQALRELRERGTCAPYEKEYLRRDGTRVPVLLADAMLPGPGEQIAAFALDLTQLRKAEVALRESERRLSEAQKMAQLGHWDWDIRSGRVEWSEEVFRIFQLDPAKFTPQIDSILALSPWPEDHERGQELIRKAMETHEKGTYEQRFLRPDKSIGYYHSTFQGKYDAGGNLTSIVGTVLDITERKRAEAALRESESRFRQLAESLPQLVWTCQPDGPCDYLNRQWIEFTGVPEAGQLGFGWLEQLHPDDRAATVAAWEAAVASGTGFRVEFRIRRRDGEYRWFDTQAVRLRDAGGHTVKWFGSNTDITERKQSEDEIRRLNAELEQRVRDRTSELLTANKELESFSYSVSHDLRAPLRAIDGFTRILTEDYTALLDTEGRRLTGIICSETKRMGALIDDLLAFSRMGRRPIETVSIDMADLARTVFAEAAEQAPDRKFEFRLLALPPAHGDPAMLRQVLANLISNAIKYTRPRAVAEIEVGGHAQGTENLYYVKDNGVGFDMKYADKLFGVFRRLHTEDEFEGTGVGLALVQRVIHRHGGRVWAEAKLNEGATLFFTLPREANEDGGMKNAE